MKGLWKYISPFAPDDSGAAAVLYGLNGIVVICDAGGCAGNICGFDEPRWFSGKKSAVFSAGLRDMDAILGRDDRLVDKLCQAAETIDADFAAIVGMPVPSVIGTDYKALKHMAEKKLCASQSSQSIRRTGLLRQGHQKGLRRLIPGPGRPVAAGRSRYSRRPRRRSPGTDAPWRYRMDQPVPGRSSWQQILLFDESTITATPAGLNLVLSPAGLKAAQFCRRPSGHLMSSITSASMPSSILTTTSFLARTSSSSIRLSLPRLWPPWPKKPVPLT